MRYALQCEHGHAFEGWFGSSGDYDDQQARGLLSCPICNSSAVRKAMMAPAVLGARSDGPPDVVRDIMAEAARAVRQHVEENFDYVGEHFAEQARAMHRGEAEEREIYGEATDEQVRALREEGAPIAALPPQLPRKRDVN